MRPVRFDLAPMTLELRVMTWVLFVLPLALAGSAVATSFEPVRLVLLGTSAFVGLTYASVWFVFRPTCFEVDGARLRIVWPVRSRTVVRGAIAGARIVTSAEFRKEYGLGIRIGAGGLWGGFGLLKTGRETFSMWLSRTDRFVVVRLRDARPLLITPDEPERFVEAVGRLCGTS